MKSLRRIVKEATGVDVGKCQACFDCDVDIEHELDIPLGVLFNWFYITTRKRFRVGPFGLIPF